MSRMTNLFLTQPLMIRTHPKTFFKTGLIDFYSPEIFIFPLARVVSGQVLNDGSLKF